MIRRRYAILLTLAALVFGGSVDAVVAQNNTSGAAPIWNSWAPSARGTMSVTAASSTIAIPGAPFSHNAVMCNTGANDAFLNFGIDDTVTATTGGWWLKAGTCRNYSLWPIQNTMFSYVAAITGSSTTTIDIETGNGSVSNLNSGTGGSGGGTVTSVSVVTANGFAGSVATATTTPAITLSTTITGALYGNGTAISASKLALTQPATGSTLTVVDGKTLTSSNTLTFAGTDGSTLNIGAGGTLGTSAYITLGANVGTWLATPSSANLAAALTDKTGTGVNVFATSPTLITPALGVATGTSLALGGATIGSNALAVTGTSAYSGQLVGPNGTITVPSFAVNNGSTAQNGLYWDTADSILGITNNGTRSAYFSSAGTFTNSLRLGTAMANFDVILARDAANTLAQRNGTNAQTFNIYNTYTDASNYERGFVSWSSNLFRIGTTNAGTGTARDMVISSAGTTYYDAANHVFRSAAGSATEWTIDSTRKLSNTSYTLGDQAQVFAITATQPASPTGTQNAITATITSAGSANQANTAFNLAYAAGYTGANRSFALNVSTSTASTNTGDIPNSVGGNNGLFASSLATTAGTNVGVGGLALGGNISIGIVGSSQTAKNSATNIGVAGYGLNTGTSPVMVGGFFSLNQTTVPTVSAALIADNGAQALPIALFRAAGVTVASVTANGVFLSSSFQATTNIGLGSGVASLVLSNSASNVLTIDAASPGAFTRMNYGGTTSSFPALKRSTTSLQARLADDSAFTAIQGKLTTDTNFTATPAVTTGYLVVYDANGDAYKVPACLASGC